MKVTIDSLDLDKHLEAHNEEGGTVRLDGTRSIGGLEGGMSPTQLVLAGLGGCSTIDIINILKKQRQDLQEISVEVDGTRKEEGFSSEFTDIHLTWTLKGDLDPQKVERAIELSITKYCSVAKNLEQSANITHSFTIQ